MDATQIVQQFLKEKNIIDYNEITKGDKIFIKTFFLFREKIIETKTSLYRPKTKNGDPRIWIYKLKENVQPNDLLALAVLDTNLVVINCSQSDLEILLDEENKKYAKFFYSSETKMNESAIELLSKLNDFFL